VGRDYGIVQGRRHGNFCSVLKGPTKGRRSYCPTRGKIQEELITAFQRITVKLQIRGKPSGKSKGGDASVHSIGRVTSWIWGGGRAVCKSFWWFREANGGFRLVPGKTFKGIVANKRQVSKLPGGVPVGGSRVAGGGMDGFNSIFYKINQKGKIGGAKLM